MEAKLVYSLQIHRSVTQGQERGWN